ncbi:hypothetical protein [Nostoc sp.]|uniref:hypothetical protein n=1 Tax=Nostoc sp. TaxID=1180 RepID=UPI002FFAC935
MAFISQMVSKEGLLLLFTTFVPSWRNYSRRDRDNFFGIYWRSLRKTVAVLKILNKLMQMNFRHYGILYIYHLIEQRNSNVNYEIAQGWGYKTSINPGNGKGVIVMSKIDAD